ncbi:NDR1/HIN1-like protein 6 [Lycium ferocissimum]|uniref:NDR1/HIN1-like protein 6 n=1 Tax=Lycium ferocissimum TaxID=112874 RepID=UPI0028164E3D|nr:NDR1/HIN1-like protein 6 [Lycium ferocissimum]
MATKPNGTTTTNPTTPTTNPTAKNQTFTPKRQTYNPNRIPYRPNRRHNRNRRCNCRRCFCQCCCWTILIIFSILVLAAIAGAIFYFLYHPQLPSFSISSLKISKFNLTTSLDDTTRLTTKFNVTLSTKNKNKKLIYTYDPVVLTAESTNHIGLANGVFPGFISTPNNVTIIHSTLSIVSQVLDVDSVSTLKSDLKTKSGLPMRILLDTKVVVKMDKLKSNKVRIRVTCDGINGPIPKGKNPTVASIATAKCKVDLRIKILRWTF